MKKMIFLLLILASCSGCLGTGLIYEGFEKNGKSVTLHEFESDLLSCYWESRKKMVGDRIVYEFSKDGQPERDEKLNSCMFVKGYIGK